MSQFPSPAAQPPLYSYLGRLHRGGDAEKEMEKGKKPPIFRTLFKEHDFANIWITSLVM